MRDLIDDIVKKCRHGQGASEAVILLAETDLGVQFPQEYRKFIAIVGWAEIGIHDVYGLGNIDVSVVRACGFERGADLDFPRQWLPISPDGFGNHSCLDADSGAVYFWDHEVRRDDDKEADSFEDWLRSIIDNPDGPPEGHGCQG